MKKLLLWSAFVALVQTSFAQNNLHLTFDSGFPTFLISSSEASYQFQDAQFSTDGRDADITIASGTYDMVFILSDRLIFKENVVVSQDLSMVISLTDAINTIALNPVDDTGRSIVPAKTAINIIFPSGSRQENYPITFSPALNQVFTSGVSNRFKIVFGVHYSNFTTNTIYNIELPLLNGVSQSQTLKNNAGAFYSQSVSMWFRPSAYRFVTAEMLLQKKGDPFGSTPIASSTSPNLASVTTITGRILMTADLGLGFAYRIRLRHSDNTANKFYETEMFSKYQGKGANYLLDPPGADIFLADASEVMTFGAGAIYPVYTNNVWDLSYKGQLRETRLDDTKSCTYEIYDANGGLAGSGMQTNLGLSSFLRGYNKLVVHNNTYQVDNVSGKATLTTVFDMQQLDAAPPNITSFQVRNEYGVPSQKLTFAAANSIRFAFDDASLIQSSVKLYVKKTGTITWQAVNVSLVTQTGFQLNPPVGSLYNADLSGVKIGSSVDVKISGADASGNSTEWVLEPAFALPPVAPVITGQNPVSTRVATPKTIALSDLIVSDADSNFPADFTLTVSSGTNYTVSGNTIIPIGNFWGQLTVPVRVNDGQVNSGTFNLKVSVGTMLELDSLALVDFYNATAGASWTSKSNWLTGKLATWKGIVVMNGRVSAFSLANNNTTGEAIFSRGLDQLTLLVLSSNKITKVDISSMKGLVTCNLEGNPLATFASNKNITYNALSTLNLNYSKLTTVDITNMPGLSTVQVNGMYPNLTDNPALTSLVTSGSVGYYPALKFLSISGTGITSLNFSGMPNLQYLTATDANLSSVDFSNNLALANLRLDGNNLTSLDLSHHPGLQNVEIKDNPLTTLVLNTAISFYSKLATFTATGNKLAKIDLSNMPALTQATIGGSSGAINSILTQVVLNETANYYAQIQNLTVAYSGVTSLALTGMQKLLYLNLPDNKLTTVDIRNFSNIKTVDVSNNLLTSFLINTAANYTSTQLLVNGNKLTFDYLEPLIGKFLSVNYGIQTPDINTAYTGTFAGGTTIFMTTSTGGTKNTYQWQKKDASQNWVAITGATSSSYSKSNASTADAGVYRCAIKNTLVTGLTLYRKEVTVVVSGLARVAMPENVVDTESEDLTVYPLPASDELTIRVRNPGSGFNVVLFDMQGRQIITHRSFANELNLNVHEYPAGVYLLKVIGETNAFAKKIQIAR